MDGSANSTMGNELIFLKLGGSLITDKNSPQTARIEIIQRVGEEIRFALEQNPSMQILLGHGSGSFGHYSGNKYKTRDGVTSQEDWLGFAEVWYDAASLNRLVIKALKEAGLAPVVFPPSSSVSTTNRKISTWDLKPLISTLGKSLLPVVYGDVVFDSSLGGTILSTEDLFVHLAGELSPGRILLAGSDPGVWRDFPECTSLFDKIQPSDRKTLGGAVGQSQATDVTGGMADKVEQMLGLVENFPGLDCLIFSGEEPGNISAALLGQDVGTLLSL